METRDDAGYVPFGGGLLLQSVDFFPPIVDDPYRFGQIAAANALSDIYAMGGRPITAMNLVGFPGSLDLSILKEILKGGNSKIEESGARLLGGHSVQDDEPKYGLSVTGFVEEDRVVRNTGAKPGDKLVLTKPLGFGILTTALKREIVSEAEIEDAVETAARLNKAAGEALGEIRASAATDVTGYGFLGHLAEVLQATGVGAVIRKGNVPVWERARKLAAEGHYPGGLKNNRSYLGDYVTADGVNEDALLPLYDPQTSGGLLVSAPPAETEGYVRALRERGETAEVVGEVVEEPGIQVV
jgi:selenide,water dikinase